MLTFGALADRYGRKRFFLAGLAIFTAGSALCAAAQGLSMLIWARAGQGVGGAILFAISLALPRPSRVVSAKVAFARSIRPCGWRVGATVLR